MEREYGWDDEILEEGGEFELLPEGDYNFTVAKVERARSSGKGKLPPCNMAKVTFDIYGPDNKHEITENFILHSSMEWKLSQLFLSVSMKKHGEPLRMNWTAIVGKTGKCKVSIRTYKKNDGSEGKTNGIQKLYAYDEQVTTVSPQPNSYSQPTNSFTSNGTSGGWTPGAF
jgi:hypothetical protein